MTCEYLREFSKKCETVQMDYSGAGGKLIRQKNQKQKSRDTVPLRVWHHSKSNNFLFLLSPFFKFKVLVLYYLYLNKFYKLLNIMTRVQKTCCKVKNQKQRKKCVVNFCQFYGVWTQIRIRIQESQIIADQYGIRIRFYMSQGSQTLLLLIYTSHRFGGISS